ncbi:hypothetical protein Sjap_022915 [Stephania japonica]|uniref:AAA+ ATPase domain-containing protein n=1 Tax=Stephania japonica TaxID=461633 RepID=A0AAP0EWX5_9MAGN
MELLLDWKSIGSLLATFMFVRTAIHDFLPPEVYQALKRLFLKIFAALKPKVSIIIEEFDNSYNNDIFDAAQTYIGSKCFSSAQVLKLSKSKNSKSLSYTMETNQNFEEVFEGFKVNWKFHTVEKKTNSMGYTRSHENRYFELSFHEKYKEIIHSSYIPHITEVAEKIKFKNRERKLYTNRSADEDGRLWSSVPFSHPSTFDTVAMDPDRKTQIQDDLIKFVNRREFYSRVGRAWKRGYLLYGPPGTGKTSLIAAIANFLEFDIYDLELTAVTSNSQLRKLLISTSSKSVVVVEDIDCSLDLSDRKKEDINGDDHHDQHEKGRKRKYGHYSGGSYGSIVSLSGVLNFVDGLWSSCGGERLMIFTTNHKEKLDPALLRPGRMDKHIELSYCEIPALKILMNNYLNIQKHPLMKDIEELLRVVKMTPADIGEIFMSCEEDANTGMVKLVEEMRRRLQPAQESTDINGELSDENDQVAEKAQTLENEREDSVEAKLVDSVEQ